MSTQVSKGKKAVKNALTGHLMIRFTWRRADGHPIDKDMKAAMIEGGMQLALEAVQVDGFHMQSGEFTETWPEDFTDEEHSRKIEYVGEWNMVPFVTED